jgi:hypothetical protein
VSRILSIAIGVYKRLLRLFPASYKNKFSEDMLLDFSDLVVDANRKGTVALLYFFLHEMRDFPVSLLRAHAEENGMLKIIRSQPVNFGLRSALGFGVVFAFALPISMFVSDILFFPVDSVVTRLSIYYYDRFHVELGFELISWIPMALSHLLTGLVLGVLFALLFTDRSKHSRYILVGTLGWFLHNVISDVFVIFFNTWVFLDSNQFIYFNYMLSAFSGAIFGLIFIVAKSERYEVVRWLTIGIFVYPLFAYLWVEQLSNFLVFNTPWRFVGLTILMVILIASVFILAINIDSRRKLPWVVIAGTVGYPALSYLVYFVVQLISPPIPSSGVLNSMHPFFWFELALSDGAYGILFGLLLGMVLGFQNKSNPSQITI